MAPYKKIVLLSWDCPYTRKLVIPERLGLIKAGWTLTDHMLPDPQSFHTYLANIK